MPEQPVDDHSEEFEQLAGLSALRVLEGEELVHFEQHAEHCQRCRLMVRLDMQALAAVSLVAPPMDPSPDFKLRLMQRAASELAASPQIETAPTMAAAPAPTAPVEQDLGPSDSTPMPPADGVREEPTPLHGTSNVLPFWRRAPWLSALAAVVVLGLVAVGAYSYWNQPVATYALNGTAPGSASVVLRRSGAAELQMSGVPDPEPGHVYEAWIIPPGQGAAPVAAGTTTSGTATVPLSGDVRGATVAITQEQGRVDAPTSAPVMAGVVES